MVKLYPKKLENVSNKEYIFDDFDKDGVANIDDPKPFNSKVSKYPEHSESKAYYHKARYGGGEVLLSEELSAIEEHNNRRTKLLKKFLKGNPKSIGRIKTVPSTMKKLRQRYIQNLKDVAGATVLTKNRKQANVRTDQIKKKYRFDKKETDNYYKNPLGGVYYAHHIGLIDSRNKDIRLEVQVKSKKMFNLHKKMHIAYKKNQPTKIFKKRAKKLFDLGF
jgi:ppGpp synthetase/RelA/SpoT-type nucleotidyltranferase|tara:strand:+ start:2410 stop:3069 length:660 start_codon:yes stop_codon:yes gene_type:complete